MSNTRSFLPPVEPITFTERPGQPGEKCTCGRPAVLIYRTESFGEVGDCGIRDGGGQPLWPCPWCGAGPHVNELGRAGKCPEYQPRTPAQTSTAGPEGDTERLADPGWWECAACGHRFELDSSPDLELCWACAEIRDAEAGL